MTYCVVIPAAGQGQRMGAGKNKLLMLLENLPIIVHTLNIFQEDAACDEVVLVSSPQDQGIFNNLIKEHGLSKVKKVVEGGISRQESVFYGLKSLDEHDDKIVLIHDGARPFVTQKAINDVVKAVERGRAAVLAVPVKDTIKKVENQQVIETLDRSSLWAVQTPQAFRLSDIMNAHLEGIEKNIVATDDASLVETLGGQVKVVQGDYSNIKLTTPDDLVIGKSILLERKVKKTAMRIGQGYDVHQLVENRPLVIGGIDIPYEKGLAGHSDADVLLHAISDALLGAIAAGDIGKHFPDTDPTYKNADSKELLKNVWMMVTNKGYKLENIDAVIIAERPKMALFIPKMQELIAELLGVEKGQINVKATTTEKLGFVGRKEGIAAQAVVLIS